jgi:hypothetical protein
VNLKALMRERAAGASQLHEALENIEPERRAILQSDSVGLLCVLTLDRPPIIQKKPRRSGASKWEERRPKRDDHSLAESSKCVPIEVAFIPSVRRQMYIANYWAISAVLKHFDENWIGGYKKGVCPFSHQRMRTTLVI